MKQKKPYRTKGGDWARGVIAALKKSEQQEKPRDTWNDQLRNIDPQRALEAFNKKA